MDTLEFFIVDVFAERKYAGNQLAVFLDAQKIEPSTMLKIAKEINFAESAFILGGDEQNGFDIKIFTPESEIPFAGHPTVGSAFVIRNYLLKKELKQLRLNLGVGRILAEFFPVEENSWKTFITQVQPVFNNSFEKAEIADLLNIAVEAINDQLPVCEVSTGLPFIIVPLKSLSSIKKIKTDAASFIDFMERNGLYKTNNPSGQTTSLFCFSPETYHRQNDYNARMLCVEDEILKEDAATGSANGCFLAYYLKYINPTADLLMEQGYEMGRPAQLHLKGNLSEGQFEIRVGGLTQLVAQGQWIV